MKENDYQAKVIKRLKRDFPGSIVLKNDPLYLQGIPDLLLLLPNGRWAALEVKQHKNSRHRPNQDYYISKMDSMSYAAFIFPENEEEVFDDLQRSLQA